MQLERLMNTLNGVYECGKTEKQKDTVRVQILAMVPIDFVKATRIEQFDFLQQKLRRWKDSQGYPPQNLYQFRCFLQKAACFAGLSPLHLFDAKVSINSRC